MKALGGAAELRLSIYEFICAEGDGVHIPDLRHEFFHEHDTGDIVSMVACEEMSWPRRLHQDEKKVIVKRRLAALREGFIFDAKLFGSQMAREVTQTFFKTNVFHFRDARLMNEFINTPFPCGSIPKDHVRNIVIYLRFEDFLERAGWNVRTCCYETPHEPGPEFKWNEINVYVRFRADIMFIERLSFAKRPKITLVMVTPFDRWDATDLDEERIKLNFLEVILPIYIHLRKIGSKVKVVSKDLGSLDESGWYHSEDEDVTWQVKIAAKTLIKVSTVFDIWKIFYSHPNSVTLEQRIKTAAAKRVIQ